ncbi:SPOR domain-containing protein [Paenibacillus sp. S-12]|uniref:SPOR domain-containing protein n=1 Tax=Paenibacillus sp. S-12 TaxID=3031371 RepID=UPI0025A0CFB6|nr:SPOR domain-containing protein [Paenibacillus sp. S-12]
MSNMRAKMTFRFDDSNQGKDKLERQGMETNKKSERLTDWEELSDGTIVNSIEPDRTGQAEHEEYSEAITVENRHIEKAESDILPVKPIHEPVENEHERVERWIRETDHQPGYEIPKNGYSLSSSIEDPASGSLSDQGELLWNGVHTRSRKPPVWRVVASVAGALATGALFGFLALSLFKGEVSMPNPNNAIPVFANDKQGKGGESSAHGTATNEQSKVKAGDTTSKPSSAASGGGSAATATGLYVTDVNIPEKVFYMLQYGVFAQEEGAQKAASELRELGMAAMAEKSDQHRVYAAIATSKEDAMGLSSLLKNKQMELYVRTLNRPAIAKLAFQGDSASVEQFLGQSDVVNDWLMTQSIVYLEKANTEAFSQEITEQLRKDHQKWTQQMSAVQKGIPDQSKTSWTELVQSMNTAISAVNEYNKQPSSSHLWSIQQAVMHYRNAEAAWLETMKV